MRISILVDLLRLPAHDTDTHYAFGASFAPGFEWDDPTKHEPVPHDVFTTELKKFGTAKESNDVLAKRAGPLVPWTWTTRKIQVWVDGKKVPDGSVKVIPLPSDRDIVSTSLDDIEKKLVGQCVDGVAKRPAELKEWHPLLGPRSQSAELPANAFVYPAYLQSAAGLPAPVPHGRFNFVMFFRVARTEITDPKFKIAAAPVFVVNSLAFDDFAAPSESDGTIVAAYTRRWDSPELPDIAVEARSSAVLVGIPDSADSFVDIGTLWLRTKLTGGGEGTVLDSWFEELPARLGGGFDLAARLIECIGKEDRPNNAKKPLRDLRQALLDQAGGGEEGRKKAARLAVLLVLRALHDRLGPSTQPDPDSPLALVHRLVPGILAANDTQTLLASLSPELSKLLADERKIGAWDTADPAQMPWADRLARRIGPVANLPASGAEFVAQLLATTEASGDAKMPFVASRLATVVAVTGTEVLASILADLWAEAAKRAGSDAEKKFADLEAGGLRARLVDAQVDARMRRALLEPAWTSENGLFKRTDAGKNDITALTDNAVQCAGDYALGTLASKDQDTGCEQAYQQSFTRTELLKNRKALREAVESEVRSSLGDLQRSLASGGAQSDAAKLAPNAAPGGITLQFDRVIRGPKIAMSDDDDDFNRNLGGFGFLARRKTTIDGKEEMEPWRCLSLVNLMLEETGFKPLKDKLGRVETIAALVPAYDGALPVAAVHYDNAPIVGRAEIGRRAIPDPAVKDPGANPDEVPALVSPVQPLPGEDVSDPPSEAAKLPFLAFGVDLELSGFAKTNHGAIPKALTEPTLADEFPALLPKDRNKLTVPAGNTRRIAYRRRVGVGALKLPEDIARRQVFRGPSTNPFSIPDGVRLISDELDVTGKPSDAAIELGKLHQRPMPRALLLHGANGRPEGEFDAAPPSVDIEVFDRWIAYDEFRTLVTGDDARRKQIRDYRKTIRSLFDEQAAKIDKETVSDRTSLSLGDPAVERLIVRATCVFKHGAQVPTPVPEEILVPWAKSLDQLLAKPTLENTHREPIKIKLRIEDVHVGDRLSFNANVDLVIEKGEVWKVELAAGVPQAQVKQGGRFYEDVLGSLLNVGGYLAAAPFAFVVEGGTRDLPTEREVYEAFVPSVDPDGRIAFAWRRKVDVAAAAVGTIEIGWQQWRMTGRPSAPFPYRAIKDLDRMPTGDDDSLSYPINWEVEGFADRPDEPSRARRFQPKLLPMVKRRTVEGDILLGREEPSPTMPARYIRFEVQAESRYARAYQPPLPPVIGKLTKTPWSTQWKRLFRPARPETVKPLAIRALVPLTRALRDTKGQPSNLSGVLLVVEGAVGEAGGVAESIEARPLRITRELKQKPEGTTKMESATEFAADPLVRIDGIQPQYAAAAADLKLAGPIGHTFDFEAKAPAFQSSSYMVLPPRFAQADPGAGWMARLRVRRVLEPRGVVGFGENTQHKTKDEDLSIPLGRDGDISITFEKLGLDAPQKTAAIDWHAVRQGDSTELTPTLKINATAFGTNGKVERVEFSFEDATGKVDAIIGEGLRSLRLLVSRQRVERQGLPVDLYEGTLEAEGESGSLVRAGEASFEDARASGEVDLIVTNAPQGCQATTLRAPLASEWTDTGWTQFLPDTTVQARDAAGVRVNLELLTADNTTATVKPVGGTPIWHTFEGLLDRSRKDDQGLVHFLILMQAVASFAGREQDEAYLGLYLLDAVTGNGEAVFKPFGNISNFSGIDLSQLRARILTVQADPRVWTIGNKKKTNAEMTEWRLAVKDSWSPFFQEEPETNGKGIELAEPFVRDTLLAPKESALRILTVLAPFGTQQ